MNKVIGIIVILILSTAISILVYKHFKNKKDIKKTGDLAKSTASQIDHKLLSKNEAERKKQIEQAKNQDFEKIGDLIYNAHGVLNDDESSVYSAFSMFNNKFELSLFIDYWKNLYKKDLFTFLKSFLDEDELGKVDNIVKKLK